MEVEKIRDNVIKLILSSRTPGCGWLHTWEERVVEMENVEVLNEDIETNNCEELKELILKVNKNSKIIIERVDDEDDMELATRNVTKTITIITIQNNKLKLEEHEEKII